MLLVFSAAALFSRQATDALGEQVDGVRASRPFRESSATDDLNRQFDAFRIVDEIDTARQSPVHEYPEGASQVATVLGRQARTLPVGDGPKVMAWVIGRGRGLQAGRAYVLDVEYPDDVPRTIFLASRGGDVVRGFATGSALGDARQQYVQPSVESLQYPQSGRWQRYRTLFFLNHRFEGLYANRDPRPGGRPFTPGDGFHVLAFQTKRVNDPRSAGVALGCIRLREVPDIAALDAKIEYPPPELPRRRVFFREEMADQAVSAAAAGDRGVLDPVDWLVYKAKLSRVLGINTLAKDLLEFGFNQGWNSGDQNWVMNAQPPLVDFWDRAVPRFAAEGLDLLPYYEYKGAIGMQSAKPVSLAWQRRAEKLYHKPDDKRYTGVWWTEDHNADLTDPDTLADARRLLDRTVCAYKGRARFAGVWFRVRDNHLPMSFSEAALSRFRTAFPGDLSVQQTTRQSLIASYEGDRKLYDRYVAWWFQRRAAFLSELRDHVARGLGDDDVQLLFTPWMCEQIPMLRDPHSGIHGHPIQVVADDTAWWDAFARKQPSESWFRWALVPTAFDVVVKGDYYGYSLAFRETIPRQSWRAEQFHSAPNADPENYRDNRHVMLTFPAGRLFTVARPDLLDRYRTAGGLTVVRHYTLNEDNHDRTKGPSNLPFDGQLGYICVEVDRAGPYVRLLEARAVAHGDPRNLGYLCASAFSTGFPEYVRRFNQAFLAVPALPSTIVPKAADDAEVVVREIRTSGRGTYYYVVNTSMRDLRAVAVRLPAQGAIRDLVEHRPLPGTALRLDLYPGELRSYRVDER
jgi:hypothetical protein